MAIVPHNAKEFRTLSFVVACGVLAVVWPQWRYELRGQGAYQLAITLNRPSIAPARKLSYLNSPFLANATALVTDASGVPMPNQVVDFQAKAIDMAVSGHDHAGSGPNLLHNLDTAPGGYFVDLVNSQSTASCMTDFSGACQLSYGSQLSGDFTIIAALDSDRTTSDNKNISAQFTGLQPLSKGLSGSGYSLVGEWNGGGNGVQSQHSANHYSTGALIGIVTKISKAYYDDPEGGSTLGINDMSLITGGLFDIGNQWTPPHRLHFYGTSVDFNHCEVDSAACDPQVCKTNPVGPGCINLDLLKKLAIKQFHLTPVPEPNIHFEK